MSASREWPQVTFDGDPPVLQGGCVNVRHRGVRCDRCSQACPVGAITLAPGPVVDREACLRCDACLPVCPTEAMGSGRSLRPLRDAVADADRAQPVTIACPRAAPSTVACSTLVHDRCLASLRWEELVVLAGSSPGGQLWVDDSACATCDLVTLRHVLAASADRANSFQAISGRTPSVLQTTRRRPGGATKRSIALASAAGNASVSRRGLFRRVLGGVVASDASDETLTPSRCRLLRYLRASTSTLAGSAETAPGHGFGRVVVDEDRCSGCALCAKLCPTHALSFEIDVDATGATSFRLEARVDRCVDCGVCTTACPDDAITVGSRVDVAAVASGDAERVAGGTLTSCESCGAPTAAVGVEHQRCFACAQGIVSPLHDEKGLMADLLRRTRA